MLGGLMLAYIINYGMYFSHGSVQWRFPLLFQLVFCGYILLVTPWLPDTPRWLMRHESSPHRGEQVLSKLRNRPLDDPAVRQEADAILEAIKIEAKEEGSWTDLFRDGGIAANKRFYLALGIQFMQQMSGMAILQPQLCVWRPLTLSFPRQASTSSHTTHRPCSRRVWEWTAACHS